MERTSVEVIEKVFREVKSSYPERTVRELLANGIIHQNLWQTGTHTMVEIFTDRIEITNPGTPLVDINRFIDTPPKSRNEKIAILMHNFDLCELRGSGIDHAIEAVEKASVLRNEVSIGKYFGCSRLCCCSSIKCYINTKQRCFFAQKQNICAKQG